MFYSYHKRSVVSIFCLALVTTLFSGGNSLSESETTHGKTGVADFNTTSFVPKIDNPFLPLRPGVMYIYRSETIQGVEVVEEFVTSGHKTILGVPTTIVCNREMLNGILVEETLDWYAQDENGNVWYFGEDTRTYRDGVAKSAQGSWEAGVNGAKPGIVMPAVPYVGDEFAQEGAPGVAEDMARVVGLSETVSVPFGVFKECLKTLEYNKLEPGDQEYKFFARNVGLVLEAEPDGDTRLKLINVIGLQ
jgi:hypothetical protein